MSDKLPVVCLLGPTACGKTAAAFELYDTGQYETVSVDSALVYKGMDIGTAKPTKQELQQYPHHLVDIIEPHQVYSAAEFVDDVNTLITQIHAKGKVPLLVGGTMLYFRSLWQGLAQGLPGANELVRAQIEADAQAQGWDFIHKQLAQVDAISAQKFLPSDKQRLMRALEVYRLTNKPISQWHQEQAQQEKTPSAFDLYQFTNVAIAPDRAWLHGRIEQRLQQMWQQGFLEEVETLFANPLLHTDMPSIRCVGYRQTWDYLVAKSNNSAYALDVLKDKALFATRQLAKRQYTWMRNFNDLQYTKIVNNAKEAVLMIAHKASI